MIQITINRILLFAAAILFLSCDDLLTPEPTASVSDSKSIYDEKSAGAALNGAYSQLMSSGYYGLDFDIAPYLFADNVKFVGIQTYYKAFVRLNNYGPATLQSDNSSLSGTWTAIYRTVNKTNHIIEKVDGVTDDNFTRDERNAILGQAYFIRALSYFDLTRFWGGVQIVTKPTTSPEDVSNIQRSSLEDTYRQIESDLKKAEELLLPTDSRIYVDLGTVQALTARIALYREQWEKAEAYSSFVISNSKYSLVKPYSVFFTTEASPESIFELNFTTTQTNPAGHWWRPSELGGRYEVTLNETVIGLLEDPAVGGNRADIITVAEKSKQIYNGMYWRSGQNNPAYLFRIAEQYLIRAEARAHLNKFEESRADINAVRNRADVPDIETSEYNTRAKALQAIETERRLEFAVENHRFFDLRRTGRLATVLGETEGYLFPIPIDEITKDPSLTPNPSN
ncbi:MAG: RagB/SusD family nutrient uptake outer membrane protein [Tannerella sp.]|jgi:hypothetical protein|nr:RagB/SusD family nutrient uptake outer membrane protein [Tannerella sp.]